MFFLFGLFVFGWLGDCFDGLVYCLGLTLFSCFGVLEFVAFGF